MGSKANSGPVRRGKKDPRGEEKRRVYGANPVVRTLALDLGTTFGYTIFEPETQKLTSGRHDLSKMAMPERIWMFHKFLENNGPFGQILFEYVQFHRSHFSSRAYWSWWSIIMLYCFTHGVPYEVVEPGPLKAWATGSGSADKEEMMRALRVRFGYSTDSDDEADSRLLFHYFFPDCKEPTSDQNR